MHQFVVIASAETRYVRRLVRRLCEQGHAPHAVLLGSRAQRVFFKLQSFRRIRSQLGLVEALYRLKSARATAQPDDAEQSLAELRDRHGFDIRSFDAMNGGEMLVTLLETPKAVAILAGAGLADRATIAAVDGRCLNGHPAILPGIRGVDVLEWAIAKQKQPGVSAHLVVPSVDAGDILKTAEMTPLPGESFDRFAIRVVDKQADTLAEAAVDYVTGRSQPFAHDLEQSELVYAAPRAVKRRARAIFVRGDSDVGGPP